MQVPEVDTAERTATREAARRRAESPYALDRQIGTTLTRLQRTPQGRRTIVVFTSDHGYCLGEHRRR